MRLGVPFIAPRQLGAIGGQQGRLFLPFVGWRTGQSGAPPDIHCRRSGADLLPILAQTPLHLQARWRTGHYPVHTGQSGVPCRPLARATRRPRIARLTVALATVGSPDSPVNYSRTPSIFPESGLFIGGWPSAWDTVRCTIGQSGVPSRAGLRLHSAKSLYFFSLFLALRQFMLVLKTMY
jgi:hypothetical protein